MLLNKQQATKQCQGGRSKNGLEFNLLVLALALRLTQFKTLQLLNPDQVADVKLR